MSPVRELSLNVQLAPPHRTHESMDGQIFLAMQEISSGLRTNDPLLYVEKYPLL